MADAAADPNLDPVPITAEIAVDLTKGANQSASKVDEKSGTDSRDGTRAPASSTPPTLSETAPPEPSPAKADEKLTDAKSAASVDPIGETITYVVHEHETLMKISFEVFGNVYRWREIYNQNRSKIGNFNSLTRGTVLHIRRSGAVAAKKNGEPYLIQRHDTLWKISDNLYGTPWKWVKLWHNNAELIHDPNHIYAGFYLYYLLTEEERQFFSQHRLFLGRAKTPSPQSEPH